MTRTAEARQQDDDLATIEDILDQLSKTLGMVDDAIKHTKDGAFEDGLCVLWGKINTAIDVGIKVRGRVQTR